MSSASSTATKDDKRPAATLPKVMKDSARYHVAWPRLVAAAFVRASAPSIAAVAAGAIHPPSVTLA